jgi:hypothetical protein
MAKRLTDTKKWESKTFRKLADKFKVFYLYLLDNCDGSGVMHLDLELINFILSQSFSLEEIKEAFPNQLIFISDDKIIIKNYIAFQNGDVTDSKSNIAKSIVATLNSHGLLKRYQKGEFGNVNQAVALWDS